MISNHPLLLYQPHAIIVIIRFGDYPTRDLHVEVLAK